jgi:TRAP-type C4-dicarboxylate transport system permease small subunit
MLVLRRLVETVTVLLLGGLVALPFAQVVLRGTIGAPMIGAEEMTRFLLICLVFVGYPIVVEAGENIVMAEFREMLPERPRRMLHLAIAILAIMACVFIGYVAATNISVNLNNATPTLKIPFWIFLGATFFGFAAGAVVHVWRLVRGTPDNRSVSL